MPELNSTLRHSLLIRIAAAMTFVVLVVLIGMGGAAILAEATRGNASAINLAGSMRMQSYRLSALVLAAQSQPASASHRGEIQAAMDDFDQILGSPILSNPSVIQMAGESASARRRVVQQWQESIKPLLVVALSASGRAQGEAGFQLLSRMNLFVADINVWVKQIEQDTESRIRILYFVISLTLLLTLSVVFITMYFLHQAVLGPLRSLGIFTAEIRRGNLAARTPNVGEDEVGRLGHAFNLMAADLDALYRSLETRVAEKTADLERSNRSLELLYHSIARLYSGPVQADTYVLLLREIEEVLDLGPGSACLAESGNADSVSVLASTMDATKGEVAICSLSSCDECMTREGFRTHELGGQSVLSIPLRDAEHVHGVMQLLIPQGKAIEPWKMRLLEALSRHIGTAIGTARRSEHDRMLSLMEERSVIARELHDSLAQSLSYMKIQVSRLAAVVSQEAASTSASDILAELREGLNTAYRQLRELLTTFRLRIEGDSLSAVLQETVREFTERGGMPIELDVHLTNTPLSANDEIHVLQIVREALSNVVHHANARSASVSLLADAHGAIDIYIDDDGVGVDNIQTQTHHYGMSIMQERARSMGATLDVMSRSTGGTRVAVRFDPANRRKV